MKCSLGHLLWQRDEIWPIFTEFSILFSGTKVLPNFIGPRRFNMVIWTLSSKNKCQVILKPERSYLDLCYLFGQIFQKRYMLSPCLYEVMDNISVYLIAFN